MTTPDANGLSRQRPRLLPSTQLLPRDAFWAMLDRERALADRGDRRFALLVFDVSPRFARDPLPTALTKTVLARVRRTDAAGWMDANRIGALLSNAGPEAARKIAEAICEHVSKQAPRPVCEIHIYPMLADEEAKIDLQFGRNPPEGNPEGAPQVSMASLERVHELLVPLVPAWKRVADVILATAMLLALSPLLLAMAVFVKTVSPGPVFFRQPRVGRACRKFMCLKFRTMHVDADKGIHARHMAQLIAQDTPMTKLEASADARLIPFARLIRASGVDELPQLINVLRGDMSLVGPRPCVPYEFTRFAIWQRRRFDTLPGITGLWQVSGKNRRTFTEMMRMDVQYASDLSASQDAKILLRTPGAVISEVLEARARQRSLV